MDTVFYLEVIEKTMGVVNTDDNSITKQAEVLVKNYLDNNTGITDDDKAKIYAKFITDVTINTMTQAIDAATKLALEGAINDQRVLSMQGELAIAQAKGVSEVAVNDQRIISMQNEDVIKRHEVAAKITKAKIEVEQLIPSQIAMNLKNVEIQSKELLIKSKEVEIMGQQLLVEVARVPLMEAQAQNELEKIQLTIAQVGVEKSKVRLQKAEISLRYADAYYRQQQAQTVANSLIVNERIEMMKSETQLKVATIQATSI